jgi:GntR family transcriptional regulator, transcriptional repressor for pyruvate dehydrogenase complex
VADAPIQRRVPATVEVGRDRTPPKASALLADEIRASILGHGLAAGSVLPSEAELVRDSGLGRATVREALRLLEAEGLILIKRGPQGGISVRRPDLSRLSNSIAPILTLTASPLRDLFFFRKAVEPAAAELAAKTAGDEQRQRLIELAGHREGAGYSNEVDFHVMVAECAGNELVRALLAVPHDLLRMHLEGEAITEEDVREANDAHRAIARAIAAGDGDRARRAMQRHLESFETRMERQGRLDQPIVPRERWLRGTAGFPQQA